MNSGMIPFLITSTSNPIKMAKAHANTVMGCHSELIIYFATSSPCGGESNRLTTGTISHAKRGEIPHKQAVM